MSGPLTYYVCPSDSAPQLLSASVRQTLFLSFRIFWAHPLIHPSFNCRTTSDVWKPHLSIFHLSASLPRCFSTPLHSTKRNMCLLEAFHTLTFGLLIGLTKSFFSCHSL